MMSQFSRILSLGAICVVYGCAGQHVLQVQPKSDGNTVVSEYGVEPVAAQLYNRVGYLEDNVHTRNQQVTAIDQQVTATDQSITAIRQRVDTQGQSITAIRQRVDTQGQRITAIEQRGNTQAPPVISWKNIQIVFAAVGVLALSHLACQCLPIDCSPGSTCFDEMEWQKMLSMPREINSLNHTVEQNISNNTNTTEIHMDTVQRLWENVWESVVRYGGPLLVAGVVGVVGEGVRGWWYDKFRRTTYIRRTRTLDYRVEERPSSLESSHGHIDPLYGG